MPKKASGKPRSQVLHVFTVQGRVIGKVLRVSGVNILFRRYPFTTAFFRKEATLSFSVLLYDGALRWNCTAFHYAATSDDEHVYAIDPWKFKKLADPQNHGEGDQLYVSIDDWNLGPMNYEEAFDRSENLIEALDAPVDGVPVVAGRPWRFLDPISDQPPPPRLKRGAKPLPPVTADAPVQKGLFDAV